MWLLIPILFYSFLYLIIRHVYTTWERRGFPSEKSNLTFKFLRNAYSREFNHVTALTDLYSSNMFPIYGFYHFFRPTLMIRNLGVARQLLENSSGHFLDNKWEYFKGYRRFNLLERLAPIFCKDRLEAMFRNIEKVSDQMVAHLETMLPSGVQNAVTMDMQNMSRIYAVNVISNLFYGTDLNLFSSSDNVFGNYLQSSLGSFIINSYTINRFPKRSSLTYRLRDVLKENTDLREEGSQIRKDVLQLLVKFRNGNDLSNTSKQNWLLENIYMREKLISIKVLSLIAEEFLGIGFRTIASAIVFTLYEVLSNASVLEAVLKEVETLAKSKEAANQLNFEDMENLKYLDACVKETLRKYPPVPFIERCCRKNFNVPGTKFPIETGKTVVIPVQAIQHDEKYFPEPNKYKPSRFMPGNEYDKDAFLAYGLGAGTCIAQNFASLVIKLALVKLFQNFNLSKMDDDLPDIGYNPAPYLRNKNGLNLKISLKPK